METRMSCFFIAMMLRHVETPVSPLMHVDMNHVTHVMLCCNYGYQGITMHHPSGENPRLLRHIVNIVNIVNVVKAVVAALTPCL